MILFKGKDNQSIALQIVNYEFPEINKGPDANWLEVYLKIKFKDTVRRVVDPCLETFEIQELIDWFKCIFNGKEPKYRMMRFTEPLIIFELLNESSAEFRLIKLEVHDDYSLEMELDSSELQRIIQGLQNELSKFPKRPV